MNLPRSSALRYSVAVVTVALALLLTLQVELMAERTPFALFFAAVMISASYGGRNPGLLTIVLSVLVADYFIIHPRYSLVPDWRNLFQLGTFVFVALLINFLASAYHRGEELLSESEDRYRVLFESIPLPLWVYDLETLAFLAVNEAAIRNYGYSREEFLSMTIKDIRPPEDVPVLLAIVGKAPNGFDVSGAWRHRKKGGTIIDVDITSYTLTFAGRRAEIVLANDITERKRAEEAREQLAAIVESSEAAIISKTLNGRIMSWNASAEKMYGYTAAEAIGQHITFIMPTERYNELAEIIEQLRRGERIEHMETVRLKKDGTRIDLLVNISPIMDVSGQVIGASTIASDITERKRAEEQLVEKNEELAALTQQFWQASRLAVMGELAASIAHELNNPLATVSLRVETLLGQLAEGDSQRRVLEIIEQEVERMGNLVGNLLQFSRRSHQQISTFDVREEIANTIEFIHYHLHSRHINVVSEFADNVPTVQADRQQLRQLFLNLLTNASDATPQGGQLTLRVAESRMESGASGVRIEFADTGIGIKAEDLSKIWEPFFTTKPEGKGTGLGLAICRRIVEEHRGIITIESEAGQGTTVRIVLPATNREEG